MTTASDDDGDAAAAWQRRRSPPPSYRADDGRPGSAASAGLHHRHPARKPPFPTQTLRQTPPTPACESPPLPPSRPLASLALARRASPGRGAGREHSSHRKRRAKWAAQCCFLALLLGYCLLLLLARHRLPSHGDGGPDADLPRRQARQTPPWAKRPKTTGRGGAGREGTPAPAAAPVRARRNRRSGIRSFRDRGGPRLKYKAPAARVAAWSSAALRRAAKAREGRRARRRRRTTPPRRTASPVPEWYRLAEHDPEAAPAGARRRGKDRDASTPKETDKEGSNLALCGTHALEAARHHPDNYRPSSPLDAQSRVLITGILSPLGLLLALALHRRCGVTNFMGLDAQFPNEALARLEMQERLGVLMAEEGMHVRFAVPFVGLVSERTV